MPQFLGRTSRAVPRVSFAAKTLVALALCLVVKVIVAQAPAESLVREETDA